MIMDLTGTSDDRLTLHADICRNDMGHEKINFSPKRLMATKISDMKLSSLL